MAVNRCPHCNEVLWERSPALEELWNAVKEKSEFTTRQIAEQTGLSVQNANNHLNKLKRGGLLDSSIRRHPTGGRENHWKPITSAE